MALLPPPAFVGKIIVVSGENDSISWHEDDGVSTYDLSASITAAEYYPDELITALQTAMDAQSLALGASNTYTWSFNVTTGAFSLQETTSNAQFYLKAKITDSPSILYGKSTDSSGNTLATGQYGKGSIGWLITASYPSLGSAFDADMQMLHFYVSDEPPQSSNDADDFPQTIAQSVSIGGTAQTYDFTGWEDDTSEFPLYGSKNRVQKISFALVTTAKKEEWIKYFWGWYGKSGKVFRYYPDNTDSSIYYQYILTGESIDKHGFSARESGYKWWSGKIEMRRQ